MRRINSNMEEIFAKLIYNAMGSDPSSREAMMKFLKFYRDNRPLFALLANLNAPTPPEKKEDGQQIHSESRPEETAGSKSVIEEYLKRAL